MVKHGEILTKDIFSWSLNQYYWMSHEWLFEVIIYGLDVIFGKFHVFVYVFSITLILLFFLFFSTKKRIFKKYSFCPCFWTAFFILIFTGFIWKTTIT